MAYNETRRGERTTDSLQYKILILLFALFLPLLAQAQDNLERDIPSGQSGAIAESTEMQPGGRGRYESEGTPSADDYQGEIREDPTGNSYTRTGETIHFLGWPNSIDYSDAVRGWTTMRDFLQSRGYTLSENLSPPTITTTYLNAYDAVVYGGREYIMTAEAEAFRDYVLGGGNLLIAGGDKPGKAKYMVKIIRRELLVFR